MIIFIFFPIISVLIQSVFIPHEAVLVTSERCTPFGCTTETAIDHEATRALKTKEPIELPIDIVEDTPISSKTSLKLGQVKETKNTIINKKIEF